MKAPNASSKEWPQPTVAEEVANSKRIVKTPYGLQDGNGVDLTLIIEKLNRSVEERLVDADQAREDALYIREHAKRIE